MKNLKLKTTMFTMIMMIFIGSVFGQSTVIVDVNNTPVDSFDTRSVDINGNLDTSKIPSQYVNLIDTFKTDTIDSDTVTGTAIANTPLVHTVPNTHSYYTANFKLTEYGTFTFQVDTNGSQYLTGSNSTISGSLTNILSIKSSSSSNIEYSASGAGRYDVESKIYHIRDTIFLTTTVGLKSIDKPTFDANVYPNPSNGRFNISFENSVDRVEIFNTNGQIVKQFRPYSNTEQVDLSNMSRGVYFVRYYEGNKVSKAGQIIIIK